MDNSCEAVDKVIHKKLWITCVAYFGKKIKKNFLKSQFVSKLENRNGFKIVKLRNLVKKISKKNYNLNNFKKEERILAYIDRTDSYIGFSWDENIKRKSVSNLFSPVYRLEKDCIIVNTCGKAEPRLFNSDFGPVFFEDGYAFALDGSYNPEWLTNELQETYVRQQLHPYGNNEMVPEPLTEDDYLNLNLYIPETNDDIDKDSTIAVNYNHTSSTKKDNKDAFWNSDNSIKGIYNTYKTKAMPDLIAPEYSIGIKP